MGLNYCKSAVVDPESLNKGEVIMSRRVSEQGKRMKSFQYGVYVGNAQVIQYTNTGNNSGSIIMSNLESFHRGGKLRIKTKGLFRRENLNTVRRATHLYINPDRAWNEYDYKVRNRETFVKYCSTGVFYRTSNLARRRFIRGIANAIVAAASVK